MYNIVLALDEFRKNDTVVDADGIPIFIDRFTERYMDDELTIDYHPIQGFTLTSPYETLSCGLMIYQGTGKGERGSKSSSC